jgi:DNA-binding CsgD family transcriptional regulator
MALDGAEDRDIAQRLFITPRSVQTTLAAIREQVGVASPEELRAALAPR